MALTGDSSTVEYCVAVARCRLCQFALVEGEAIVAELEGYGLSCKFEYRRHESFLDEELDVDIHMCSQTPCQFRNPQTVWFHHQCYQIRTCPVTSRFLTATEYTLEPSIGQEQQRSSLIQSALAENLQSSHFSHRELPPELWLIIAGWLTREFATITALEQVRKLTSIEDHLLDLARPVYVSYIQIDGHSYVRSLRNSAPDTAGSYEHSLRELTARTEYGESKTLFIAEDNLGIRELMFYDPRGNSPFTPPNVPSAWWRHVACADLPSTVFISNDGLKVRQIESVQRQALGSAGRISWEAPVTSTFRFIDLFTPEKPPEHMDGMRMRSFKCNDSSIEGYSVLLSGTRLMDIVAHERGKEVRRSFYERSRPVRYWMYMPIHNGEYLTDICRRFGHLVIGDEVIGITLTTNKGRTVVFGMYGHEGTNLQRIISLTNKPQRVHFNESNSAIRNIKVFAVEDNVGDLVIAASQNLPDLPVSISPMPCTGSNQPWTHTTCSMQGVRHVHLCVDRTAQYRPVMGMLLGYADGRYECVGQFRHDWIAETIALNDMTKLFVEGKRTERNWAYVATVATEKPIGQAGGPWGEIPLKGVLEWWFSSWHTLLYHDGHLVIEN